MCIFVTATGLTKGPWQSDYVKLSKKYWCDYCQRVRSKMLPYKWVDGLRSCRDCNGDE